MDRHYENYPCWIVSVSNLFSLFMYVLGSLILYQIGFVFMLIYILFVLSLEVRLLSRSCVNCYYYGKYCAFGKGKVAALFFRKGDSKKFHKDKITWLDLLPDFLVLIIPLVVGVVLLIRDFNWLILLSVIALVLLATAGNGFVRSSLACRFCKQRKLGCPAEQLFNKKKA